MIIELHIPNEPIRRYHVEGLEAMEAIEDFDIRTEMRITLVNRYMQQLQEHVLINLPSCMVYLRAESKANK